MITTMPEAIAFDIEMKSGVLHAKIFRPAESAQVPAVMVCRGVHMPSEDAAGFFDDLGQSFVKGGLALILYEPRCADLILDEFHAHTAAQDVEDGAAILSWMMSQKDIDSGRIGLIGYSLGAIAAAAVAKRYETVSRLCLLAPATASYVAEYLVRTDGHPSPLDPELLPASYVPSLNEIESPRDAAFHNRPTLIMHGAADRMIQPEASLDYVQALEAADRSVEFTLIARADHVFSQPAARASCVEKLTRFFADMESHVMHVDRGMGS